MEGLEGLSQWPEMNLVRALEVSQRLQVARG